MSYQRPLADFVIGFPDDGGDYTIFLDGSDKASLQGNRSSATMIYDLWNLDRQYDFEQALVGLSEVSSDAGASASTVDRYPPDYLPSHDWLFCTGFDREWIDIPVEDDNGDVSDEDADGDIQLGMIRYTCTYEALEYSVDPSDTWAFWQAERDGAAKILTDPGGTYKFLSGDQVNAGIGRPYHAVRYKVKIKQVPIDAFDDDFVLSYTDGVNDGDLDLKDFKGRPKGCVQFRTYKAHEEFGPGGAKYLLVEYEFHIQKDDHNSIFNPKTGKWELVIRSAAVAPTDGSYPPDTDTPFKLVSMADLWTFPHSQFQEWSWP